MSQPEHDRRVDYVEITVPDLDAAKAFYGGVFGWSFTDYGPEYTAFHDGRLEGGFAKGTPATAAEGAVLVVFYGVDLEALVKVVEDNDGTISKPIFPFPGGRRFHFVDPFGNAFAIWSATPAEG